ncbi:MAG: hypothetical protein NVSMB44_45480 [Ktedonobacteraceae bacterium]
MSNLLYQQRLRSYLFTRCDYLFFTSYPFGWYFPLSTRHPEIDAIQLRE